MAGVQLETSAFKRLFRIFTLKIATLMYAKHWIAFDFRRCPSRKFEVLHWTLGAKIKGQQLHCINSFNLHRTKPDTYGYKITKTADKHSRHERNLNHRLEYLSGIKQRGIRLSFWDITECGIQGVHKNLCGVQEWPTESKPEITRANGIHT